MNIMPILSGVFTATVARNLRRFNKPIRPRLVTYDLTYKCNCKCKVCDIWKMPDRCNEELSLEDIDKIFRDKLFENADMVRITGGEPFLRNDIKEVVKKIFSNSKAKILHITTNGSFPEAILDFVKYVAHQDINLNIQVSVDGNSSVHDDLRGYPGLFDKAYKTLESLKKELEKSRFTVGVNQVISSQQLSEIDVIDKLTSEFGFGHTIILASTYHEGKDMKENNSSDFRLFKPLINHEIEWFKEFYSKVEKIYNKDMITIKGKKNYLATLRRLSDKYLAEGGKNRLLYNKQIPKPPCMAFFTYFRLLPNGDVVSCCLRKNKVIGNLRMKKLTDIWYSKEAILERIEIKNCSGCWVECEMSPSAFYSMDMVYYYLKKSFL